jgi:hypothetical protein
MKSEEIILVEIYEYIISNFFIYLTNTKKKYDTLVFVFRAVITFPIFFVPTTSRPRIAHAKTLQPPPVAGRRRTVFTVTLAHKTGGQQAQAVRNGTGRKGETHGSGGSVARRRRVRGTTADGAASRAPVRACAWGHHFAARPCSLITACACRCRSPSIGISRARAGARPRAAVRLL